MTESTGTGTSDRRTTISSMATSAARTAFAFDAHSDLHKQREIIESLSAGIRLSQRWELASLVNWAGAAREPLHRWFRYREAFAPGLIDALQLQPPFLDPFSGCGSIIVGAAQRGLPATGIDVNPLGFRVTSQAQTSFETSAEPDVGTCRRALLEGARAMAHARPFYRGQRL